MGLGVALNMTPDKLNFVVYGSINFTFADKTIQCPDFRIAQGHGLWFSNNWWMGSSDCAHIPESHQIVCCCGNHLCNVITENYAISITAGDNDHMFEVREYSKPS